MKRLLIVEDEEVIAKALKRLLERNHYVVETAPSVERAIELQPASFDLVLADLRLPGAPGTSIIQEADPVPVLIMTSHASVRSAVDAMRHGAIDYIAKPFDHDELLMIIERALTQNLMQAQNLALRLDVRRMCAANHQIQGTILEGLLATLSDIGDSDQFMHFYGERGTDREGLARALHEVSKRREAPFLIAEVSGHDPAADTVLLFGNNGSANGDTLPIGGYLQAAQNGTLVIRHVHKLTLDTQRLLAETLYGGSLRQTISGRRFVLNVKTITIGDSRIEALAEAGTLCAELTSVLTEHQVEVPPLRKRPRDIIPLAEQQLRHLEQRHAFASLKLSEEAESALLANQWPGNVTELNNVITRAALICRTSTLSAEDLGFNQALLGARDLSLDEYFRYVVLRNQTELSETELASRLGISRKALWERRQKMQLLREPNDSEPLIGQPSADV
ncbi:MAG: sigma-54-dependent transcriptional regulator [Granulosicoccus sp.]